MDDPVVFYNRHKILMVESTMEALGLTHAQNVTRAVAAECLRLNAINVESRYLKLVDKVGVNR